MKFFFTILFGLSVKLLGAQYAENIVVVTIDGLRWQEVFNGADDSLLYNPAFVHDTAELAKFFGGNTITERRKKLMPFTWSVIARKGQLHGNRAYGSYVNVQNRYWFSYPGYNEMFTGNPDTSVNSNDKKMNAYTNVLEFLNKQPGYAGRVAAFSSWDCFDAILNEPRSGFPVNSGFDSLPATLSPRMQLLHEMQKNAPRTVGESVRPDFFTYSLAKEYLREKEPALLYIAFDEPDDYAHSGQYDHYLYSVHKIDNWLEELWGLLQQLPRYRNNTALLVLADHGRGDVPKENWKHHGQKITGADEIWLLALGAGIKTKGEVKQAEQLFQSGLAQTIARLAGFTFTATQPIAPHLVPVLQ